MAFANWIHLKAQSVPSTYNGLSFRMLPSSRDMVVLNHPDIPLTPARYVGYNKPDEHTTTTDSTNSLEDPQPNVCFEMAPSTITPCCCCYTFNNKR
jgi:hypothetical protein